MIFTTQSGKRRDTGKTFAVLVVAMLSATVMAAQARPQKPIAAPTPEPTTSCVKSHGDHWMCAICIKAPILGLICKSYDVISPINPEHF